jgi:hypothetical protein
MAVVIAPRAVFLEPGGAARSLKGMNVSLLLRPVPLSPLATGLAALSFAVLVSGCSARAGNTRLTHPMLRDHSGHQSAKAGPWDLFTRQGDAPTDSPLTAEARREIAEKAAEYVGKPRVVVGNLVFRQDCSGTARGIYAAAGYPLGGQAADREENDVSILHRYVAEVGSLRKTDPRVGDLVFFDNTYDRNGDGKANDPLSHIGVVEDVLSDGTVVFVHRVSGGILRYRLNLDQPSRRRDEFSGKRLNHVLRAQDGDIDAATTAELFVAFGTVVVGKPPPRVAVR